MPPGVPVPEEKVRQILELKRQGYGKKKIGKELNMDPAHIHKIIKRATNPKPQKPRGRPRKTTER